MKYGFYKEIKGDFETVKGVTINKLKDEGFGVLYNIDMKEKFKSSLNEDFRKYEMLGACNPKFAKQAIEMESNIGLLLPCNVLIDQINEDTIAVSIVKPTEIISITENENMMELAKEIDLKLKRVIENI